LRKQGSNHLAEEQEKIRLELAKEKEQISSRGIVSARMKLSWKVDPEGTDPYSQEKLHSILQKYGNILALLISTKKKGSAIVEFANKKDANLKAILFMDSDNNALVYNSDIITIVDPKESMVEYYENLVIKTMLEMEKSEEMIAGLLKEQSGEEEEEEYSMEELTQYIEEVKNRILH
jgi:DnaJ family protein C protein 17